MKMQATDWEKMFAGHISEEKLVLRIYNELSKATERKQITQFENGPDFCLKVDFV